VTIDHLIRRLETAVQN